MTAELWVALVIAILGTSGLLGWAQWYSTNKIDSTATFVDAATKLVKPLQEQISHLEERIDCMEEHIEKLEKERVQMIQYMLSNGIGWPPV